MVLQALGTFLLTASLFAQDAPATGTAQSTPPRVEQSAPPSSSPEHSQITGLSGAVLKVTTKMVLIDVVVTGRDGKPVGGLTAEDFEVLENGEKQDIKAFGVSTPPKADAPQPQHRVLPPGMFTNTIDFRPEEGAPVIMLFDTVNTPWADQAYGRSQLLEFLKKNAGRRNIAIYLLGHKLQLIQDFTNDPEVLEQVASGLALRALPPDVPDSDAPAIDPTAPVTTPSNDPSQLLALVNQQLAQDNMAVTKHDRDMAIAVTLEAFRNIARHAGALPGRKELVWLSSGFPLNFDVAANTNFVAVLQETTSLLTDAEVSVYPVDISGLVAFDPNSVQAGMAHLNATHAGMYQIASRTGGLALYERNDIDRAIQIAVDDGSTYYVLGYYPKNKKWNGEFRNIHVNVRKPGLQVRSRKGYYAVAPANTTKPQAEAAHSDFLRAITQDNGASGMLPLFVQVVVPDKGDLDRHVLTLEGYSPVFVDFRVDPRSLLFTPQANGVQQSELRFITMVLDQKGKPVTTKSDSLTANLTPATYAEVMRTSLAFRQKLSLAPGRYRLRVGVCDLKSNLIGTLTAHAEVPPQKP